MYPYSHGRCQGHPPAWWHIRCHCDCPLRLIIKTNRPWSQLSRIVSPSWCLARPLPPPAVTGPPSLSPPLLCTGQEKPRGPSILREILHEFNELWGKSPVHIMWRRVTLSVFSFRVTQPCSQRWPWQITLVSQMPSSSTGPTSASSCWWWSSWSRPGMRSASTTCPWRTRAATTGRSDRNTSGDTTGSSAAVRPALYRFGRTLLKQWSSFYILGRGTKTGWFGPGNHQGTAVSRQR